MADRLVSKTAPRHDDLPQTLHYKAASFLGEGVGLGGNDIIDDNNLHENRWRILHALDADVVLASVTFAPGTSTGSLAGKTLPRGERIYGNIIRFQRASGGTLIAYRAIANYSGNP